ncbi:MULTISPECIES: hypothetical protein [Pseudomonas]|jgi:hypothetical protein|uniref:DUF3592 domain-containing protein n=1 Tax=Pseudomonas cremoris TaxID=2724178 RepID=A0ABR6TCU3_9PSED|nr:MULTISPECIES: hypothetical protein [Pseudomonas]MBC2383778.1 hypothetical protein [Pseudomonas cremoris]
MFNFIISITWQVLVFWVATKIGFSMQVIDSATVFVKQTEICQYLQIPVQEGHCRVVGRVEGNLGGTWTVTPRPELPVTFELPPGEWPLMYNSDDWHMVGGTPAVAGLTVVAIFFAGIGVWGSFWVKRRQLRRSNTDVQQEGA